MRRRRLALASILSLLAALALASAAHGSSVSGLDKTWLQGAIQGDRFEIAGGKIAQKSQNPAVRALGARLVKDHAESLSEARRLARRLHVHVPKGPTETQGWQLDILNATSGSV